MFSATAQALVVVLFEQRLPLLFSVLPLLSGRPQLIRTRWTKCLIVCLAALLSKIAGSSSRLPDAQSGLIPVTLEWVPEQNHSQREKDQP
jgi:hypothetical protein